MGAFDRLYGRYERRLFGFLLRLIGDRADAEEVFHDVFVKVMTGPEAHFEDGRFMAYLFRTARNLCANLRRGAARGQRAFDGLAHLSQAPPSPEDRLVEEERAFQLAKAAAELPGALADVFALRTSGLSYDEIAGALGIPLGTVKSRMNALMNHLKTRMES